MAQNAAVLLPYPQNLQWRSGTYHIPDEGIILLDSADAQAILPAGAAIERVLWTKLRLNWEISAARGLAKGKVQIEIRRIAQETAHSQLYTLVVNQTFIAIESNTPAGLYYGAQTLGQLIGQFGREIPCAEIQDWPDFDQRGVMLDISRDKVYKNETLYDLVDRLASIKINQIQLYTEHTFAYHNHPEVWKEASPMTGEDILALDRFCRERYIELVPNQNSFGHMEQWLKHPRYADLAEVHGEFTVPWGTMKGPFSLAPEEPGSLNLITGLYDELLPHFSSKTVNVGCDETFDLGSGKSSQACEQKGMENVYLEYLLRLYDDVVRRGYKMQFWGDIILLHPDLVKHLPKDLIALEWGYEAEHPFAEHSAIFAASGLPFYVCPGTSAWNSIAGRTDNTVKNLLNAAENGKKNKAVGYMITDWGDNGHWQELPVSFLGYAVGAAYAWAVDTNRDMQIPQAVSRFMFDDPSGITGQVVFDLGNVYLQTGIVQNNGTLLFDILQQSADWVRTSDLIRIETLQAAAAEVVRIQKILGDERMTRPDAELIHSEIWMTVRMLNHACSRGIALKSELNDTILSELESDLSEIVQEYRRLWLVRNRPGGLTDSMRKMDAMLAEYSGLR